MDKDCDTYNETYAFMAQKLAVIVFLQILMWALSKTSLKIYSERKSLPNSQCYKSKVLFFSEKNTGFLYSCLGLAICKRGVKLSFQALPRKFDFV